MIDVYVMREEYEKCQSYRNVIHEFARGSCVKLKEKFLVRTESPGYDFEADKVVDEMDSALPRIMISNSDGSIRCNSIFLNSVQMRYLARAVTLSKLKVL